MLPKDSSIQQDRSSIKTGGILAIFVHNSLALVQGKTFVLMKIWKRSL